MNVVSKRLYVPLLDDDDESAMKTTVILSMSIFLVSISFQIMRAP